DDDASVHPGAPVVPYDGGDNDCNGDSPDDDLDGDGLLTAEDCDDSDGDVHPGAAELDLDGIDNDCDPSTCAVAGFATTPIDWNLPPYPDDFALPFAAFFSNAPRACPDGRPEYEILDMTGDGFVDLVVVEEACFDEVVGA